MSSSQKTRLRAKLKAIRATASAARPDASEKLIDAFPASHYDWQSRVVAGYYPIGSEIDPRPLLRHLQALGAQLALPRITPDGPVDFHRWTFGEALQKGQFGLQEPYGHAALIRPDFILVPLLGVDRQGHRLGYGQGHYDRTLSNLRQTGDVIACGIGYFEQIQATLPIEPHDEKLDWLVTDECAILFAE